MYHVVGQFNIFLDSVQSKSEIRGFAPVYLEVADLCCVMSVP